MGAKKRWNAPVLAAFVGAAALIAIVVALGVWMGTAA